MLAIDMIIYINNQRRPGVLVITQDILILLYKNSKNVVIPAINFDQVAFLYMAENLPSAGALALEEQAQAWTQKSHLVIESPSMGLLMRYILVMNYKCEIDFCKMVQIQDEGRSFEFEFKSLSELKRAERDAFSNGVVRSTRSVQVFQLEENTWSAH